NRLQFQFMDGPSSSNQVESLLAEANPIVSHSRSKSLEQRQMRIAREPCFVSQRGQQFGHSERSAPPSAWAIAMDECIDCGAAGSRSDLVGKGFGVTRQHRTDSRLGSQSRASQFLKSFQSPLDAWAGRCDLPPHIFAVGFDGEADSYTRA